MRDLIDAWEPCAKHPLHGKLGRGLQEELGPLAGMLGIGIECDGQRIEVLVDDGIVRKEWRLDFAKIASIEEASQLRKEFCAGKDGFVTSGGKEVGRQGEKESEGRVSVCP